MGDGRRAERQDTTIEEVLEYLIEYGPRDLARSSREPLRCSPFSGQDLAFSKLFFAPDDRVALLRFVVSRSPPVVGRQGPCEDGVGYRTPSTCGYRRGPATQSPKRADKLESAASASTHTFSLCAISNHQMRVISQISSLYSFGSVVRSCLRQLRIVRVMRQLYLRPIKAWAAGNETTCIPISVNPARAR